MNRINSVRRLATAAVLWGMLSACTNDNLADLQSYVAEVKARQKVNVEPLPEIRTAAPFLFRPDDLRDPFNAAEKPSDAEAAAADNGIRPDTSRSKELLESYDLDTLRMVGTIDMFGTLWGLVRATDGTIYRVRVGNYLGRNFGRITRVTEGGVELVEIVPDAQGAWLERNAALSLVDTSNEKK